MLPTGDYAARGWVNVPVRFAAGLGASISIDAGIGDPTATLSAGVFGSLTASASATGTALAEQSAVLL